MEQLTIQMEIDGGWVDMATLDFPHSEEGDFRTVCLAYTSEHFIEYMEHDDQRAVSVNYPVRLYLDRVEADGQWLRFLDDIVPAGASRRYWVGALDLGNVPEDRLVFTLLKHGCVSPIGNMRIKESFQDRPENDTRTFPLSEVCDRNTDFLEYANSLGVMVGGATGAGGEAPKMLLSRAGDEVWIDHDQSTRRHVDEQAYLVKYPRGRRTTIDCDVLRAEFHFYQELAAMGFDTIPVAGMMLQEGVHVPSLWLPRFDVEYRDDGTISKKAVESVYSMLCAGPGTLLEHGEVIELLVDLIANTQMVNQGMSFDIPGFVIEWVKRDLLNIAFGNSDNHGRNTSFIRGDGWIKLAPIYDFAPMKADPAGVPRTTTWGTPLERGGEYNFEAIAESLSEYVEPDVLLQEMRELAASLVGLKARLVDRGVPDSILNFPSIGFDYLEDKLVRWRLL